MDSVVAMLKSNRYLHLGTCKDDIPSVSLMNYTFADGLVVLASPANTAKLANIEANPNVSLLVHDLIDNEMGAGLSDYLKKLNQTSLSVQKSATITGNATIAKSDVAEKYRGKALEAHPDAECFIKQSEIILVKLKSARLSDSLNQVAEITF